MSTDTSSPTDPPDPGASGSGDDPDRLAAASPATPAAELTRIAASRPDLYPALAANPATYPDLVDWLRLSPDPSVKAALARRTAASAQSAPEAAPVASWTGSGPRGSGWRLRSRLWPPLPSSSSSPGRC